MTRLHYSPSAFIRSMQMSRAELHVFVEGRDLDPYVYGMVLEDACAGQGGYRLIRADEIPGETKTGKGGLLSYYDKLRRRKELARGSAGLRYSVLFILDKDIDDLLRRRRRSPHVIYTPTYDVEGLVFVNCDLRRALAAVCCLAPNQVEDFMPHPDAWIERVMEYWRDWVELCVFARRANVRGVSNFGVDSQVNVPITGPSDPVLVATYRRKLGGSTGLNQVELEKKFRWARGVVEARYSSGKAPEVFKGKWFQPILDQLVKSEIPEQHKRVASFKRSLTAHAAQTLDPNDEWADFIRVGVREALQSGRTR